MLGKSFTNIAKDLSNGFGIGKSVFGGTSVSRSDIEAVKNISSAMKNGSTLAQAWRENLNGCSSAIKTQIYECKKSGKSLDELIAGLEGTGTASKAAAFGMNLLSTAANMAVSFGISMLIQGLFQVISASNDIREQAQEVGSAFNSTESDINSCKERVQELHDTINDSQSSFQDITDARKELYSIQSEMVDKYGNEVGAIEAITKAVDVQSQYVNKAAESWAKLTDTQWQASKNDFNRTTFWKRISNAISGYSNNIDRMESEYGKYRSRINLSTFADPNAEEFDKFKELLEKKQ